MRNKKKTILVILLSLLGLSTFSCILWDYDPGKFLFPSCAIKTAPEMSEYGVIYAASGNSVDYTLFVSKEKDPDCVSFRVALRRQDGAEWVNCVSECTVTDGKTTQTDFETYIVAAEKDDGWHIGIRFSDISTGVNQFKILYQEYFQYKDWFEDELESHSHLELPLKIIVE